MKEYKFFSFQCNHCGIQVKTYINKNIINFSINDKLYSGKDVLSKLGYYVCVDCHKRTNIRFEFVYK